MEDLTTKIDRYLTDKMSEEEKQEFEIALADDPDLQEELNLQKKTVALLERAAYIDLKEKVAAINQKPKDTSWMKPLLSVAAILIVLLIPSYFYVSSTYSDASLYASYSQPYPDRITQMGAGEDQELNAAMEHYNKAEYAQALVLFESIQKSAVRNDNIALYQAVAFMETDQPQAAVDILKAGLENTPKNSTAFEWQLILAHLANDEGEIAVSLLNDFLQHNDGYQQGNAEDLLEDLESFWR